MIDRYGTKPEVGDEVRVDFIHDRKRKTVIGTREEFVLLET